MSITIYHKMWGMVSMKERDVSGASPLIRSDPFVLVWNDPWDARLISWQF